MPKPRHLLDNAKMSRIAINVLLRQTPGGMLSNPVNRPSPRHGLRRQRPTFA